MNHRASSVQSSTPPESRLLPAQLGTRGPARLWLQPFLLLVNRQDQRQTMQNHGRHALGAQRCQVSKMNAPAAGPKNNM